MARRDRQPTLLAVVLLAALAVRGGALGLGQGRLGADPDGYRRLAENIARYGVFGHGERPTAFRPPLYPLLLAGMAGSGPLSDGQVAALHLALGMATVLLVWMLARRAGLGTGVASLAALLAAASPVLLNQSMLVMTETLAALLAAGASLAFSNAAAPPGAGPPQAAPSDRNMSLSRVAGGGLLLGLGALCRPTFLPWALLLAGWLLFRGGAGSGAARWRRGATAAAVLLAVLLATLLPWIVRNARALGRPIATTSHGGYTLLLGNNPEFYEHLRQGRGAVWDATPLGRELSRRASEEGLGELAADQAASEDAWRTIRAEPGTFALASALRVGWLWRPLPHPLNDQESPSRRAARWLVAVWYIVLYGLAAHGVWLERRRLLDAPWAPALLLALTLTLLHAFYWSNMRMRAPFEPALALLAARGALSGRRR